MITTFESKIINVKIELTKDMIDSMIKYDYSVIFDQLKKIKQLNLSNHDEIEDLTFHMYPSWDEKLGDILMFQQDVEYGDTDFKSIKEGMFLYLIYNLGTNKYKWFLDLQIEDV